MECWQKQLIRSLFHYSRKRMNIERAFIVKTPHIPKRLYKYRQFTRNHVDALEKNVLWMSSPDNFNDPFDSTVSFDPNRFLVENQSVDGFVAMTNELQRTVTAGGTWRPKTLVNPITQREWRRRVVTELLKDIDDSTKVKFAEFVEIYFNRQTDVLVRNLSDGFRKGYSVISLSVNCCSTQMWSHYSDKHRGFAIEYDYEALPHDDLRKRLCFPVFYTKKLRDATRYLADMSDFNNLFGQYICLIKEDQWAYEKEWRIIYAIGPSHANFELTMPQPTAIILGSQVKKADEDAMSALCQTHGIPLRRIIQRSGTFDLSAEDVPLS